MNILLTPIQGFYVMYNFLEDYFRITFSDSLAVLLSGMQFLDDGETADPILWQDWCNIVGNRPITMMQAFQGMDVFLHMYFQRTTSMHIKNLFNAIASVIDNTHVNEQVWQKWISATEKVLVQKLN